MNRDVRIKSKVPCRLCHKYFLISSNDSNLDNRKYCSLECYRKDVNAQRSRIEKSKEAKKAFKYIPSEKRNKKIQEKKKRQCTGKLFLQSIIYKSYTQTYI